jgi:hypothetical protein
MPEDAGPTQLLADPAYLLPVTGTLAWTVLSPPPRG